MSDTRRTVPAPRPASRSLWLGLSLCNLIWALNPSAAKVIITEAGPYHTAWLRYASALLAFWFGITVLKKLKTHKDLSYRLSHASLKDWGYALAIGATTGFVSPLSQMLGIQAASATHNALLVAMEPLFTVFLAWLILREKPRATHWIAFGIAIAGFVLISGIWNTEDPHASAFLVGDLILLLAMAGESAYSSFARILSPRHSPTAIFGTALLGGVSLLSLWVFSQHGLPDLGALSLSGWLSVLWIGPLGTTVTYLYWLFALNRDLPIATLALTLFLQPVIGALAGSLVFGETLGAPQIAGTLLIIVGVLFPLLASPVKDNKLA